MTCQQLGGACGIVFMADTFEAIAEMRKKHGMEMFQAGDAEHLEAMNNLRNLMQIPAAMEQWLNGKKKEFDALPDIT